MTVTSLGGIRALFTRDSLTPNLLRNQTSFDTSFETPIRKAFMRIRNHLREYLPRFAVTRHCKVAEWDDALFLRVRLGFGRLQGRKSPQHPSSYDGVHASMGTERRGR